jgi:nitroimidazol reductase NimA-like FMN-containing flavoprotein (pyridoxamine 5'-phosphate oxidase superfamily)
VVALVDDGHPFAIPMVFARWSDRLILHGARASRLLKGIAEGPICVTVVVVDGLVLARSAMHHSMNYRSVMLMGQAVEIVDHADKLQALRQVVNHGFPERWSATRAPSEGELRATAVFSLPINEASVKVRAGGPLEDEGDLVLTHWAGVLPLRLVGLDFESDPVHPPPCPPPDTPARYFMRAHHNP